MTPNFIRFLAASFSVAVLLLAYHLTRADEQDDNSSSGIAAVHPAGPEMFSHGRMPVMFFGTKSCGEMVIWLVYEDGYMSRIDKDHRPHDWQSFMKDLENSHIPSDVVVIPCTGGSL